MDVADVLVIGAGAAGAALCWRLSEQSNLRVVCLEQGGHPDPSSYPSTGLHWEETKFDQFHVSPNVRNGPSDYPIDDLDSPISIANFNAVGGSTILFSGHFPRFHPSDFRVRSLDGVAEDWPFDYFDLEPYYALNDQNVGVSGLEGDPAYPPIHHLLPPVPIGVMGTTLAAGFNQLGWHWWPSYSAIITRPKGNRSPCVNLGPCNLGCAQGAKSSADVTYWPMALRNRVELRVQSRVSQLVTNNSGRIESVKYFSAHGNLETIYARCVVLACNGIGTPRLLLNSANNQFQQGLSNSSGLVGRNLMLHPCGYVEGRFDFFLDSHHGPQGCCIYSHEFYETDRSRGFLRGYTLQVIRGPGPLEAAISGTQRGEVKFGHAFADSFCDYFSRTAHLAVIVEDLPDTENMVTLHKDKCDRFGIPVPKVTYRMSENSKKSLAHGLTSGRRLMHAAGAKKSSAFGPVRHTGWHLMGTARSGVDPSRAVVNAFGQSHDHPNLFIADSSVFVTSAAVNPTSTIQAFALRCADFIQSEFSNLSDHNVAA